MEEICQEGKYEMVNFRISSGTAVTLGYTLFS